MADHPGEQNLNIMGRLLACETIMVALLMQDRNRQQVCTQATKIIETYEAQMRKAIRPGDAEGNIELSLKMFAEAKSNIAATAQSLR